MKKLLTASLLAVMSTAALAADEPAAETAAETASEPLSLSTPLVGDVTVAETVVIGAAIVGAAAAASKLWRQFQWRYLWNGWHNRYWWYDGYQLNPAKYVVQDHSELSE